MYLPIYLSISASFYLFIYLSIWLSIFLYLSVFRYKDLYDNVLFNYQETNRNIKLEIDWYKFLDYKIKI